MLTPLDIHSKVFKKSMRGYAIDEVDEFLDEVIKDFESLYKENLELKEQIVSMKDNINRYREMENTLQSTMVLAQKMAEEAKRNAEKEAELIIWEARKKAEQIVSGAQDQITESARKLENMRSFENQLVFKLKNFLKTQLELLENPGLLEPDNTIQVQKESWINVSMECSGD